MSLTREQTHRILERIQRRSMTIKIIEDTIALLKEQEDSDFNDIQGMMNGSARNGNKD